MLIDTHCHLDFPEFDPDRDLVLRRAKDAGVARIINIGSSLQGSIRCVELARDYDCVYAAVGIHPHEADRFLAGQKDILRGLARREKVAAIGEIGLDYFKNYAQAENQRVLFTCLLEVARELGLPVVIHSRSASDDTLKILKEHLPLRVVVHCFSGEEKFLKECLGLDFYISFTCNITYKKADRLRELVKIVPLEKLFLETDAPFLPPEGLRGRRNEPANIKQLAQELAKIKEVGFEEVAAVTSASAKKFFNLQ
jgi:TatD DNase family protein